MDENELITLFRKACTVATFLTSRESTCAADRIGIDFNILAIFKYLLPDDITFAYEDTPSDTVFGSVPDQVLVFKFNEKGTKNKKQSAEKTIQIINNRIAKFERSLKQYFARGRSLNDIKLYSMPYLPSSDPFSEDKNTESKKKNELVISDTSKLETSEIFDEVSATLTEIITQVTEPPKEATYGEVPPKLKKYIQLDKIWNHQSKGLEYLLESDDNHLVVSTPTASGKSLIFHTIVKYILDSVDESTALFIYPTKALAQDQLRAFSYEQAFTFDGDTDFKKRNYIRDNARILFINPDILHTTILPHWQEYIRILSNLRCVVMDEIHYYSGIFGANVAMVLRRLRRICSQLGATDCQFIGCSATVNDPISLMSTLTGINKEKILCLDNDSDGSPSGAKRFIFSTTGYMVPDEPESGRMHPISEAAPLLVRMVKYGLKVIAFCRFRRDCELLLRKIYEIDPDLRSVVKGYRGGYNPEERREIEYLMFNDKLKGIVATSALEVGIDIGSLDAAIIVGFPYSVSSFRQQVGRVGRRQKDSLVVYIADGSILGQSYAADPDKVLKDPVSQPPIVLHDSLVRSHLQAAAYEQALSKEDGDFDFFPHVDDINSANLEELENGCFTYPVKPSINIRKANDEREDTLVIDVSTNKVIESIEYDRVSFTLYEGAIFIHQGKSYLVTYLEPDLKYAKVQRTHVKWITRQRDYTDVDPIASRTSKYLNSDNRSAAIGRGVIKVTTKVFGYFKFNENNQIIDAVDVNIPPAISYKSGTWINIPAPILNILETRKHHIPASIHGAEHAIMSILPLYVPMSIEDIATECKAPEKDILAKRQTNRIRPARLIFYEKFGGKLGNGILSAAYDRIDQIIRKASSALDSCPCESGCSACVGAGKCVEKHIVLSKNGARVILRLLLNQQIDHIPEGPDPNMPDQKVETVVAVSAVISPNEDVNNKLPEDNVSPVKKDEITELD